MGHRGVAPLGAALGADLHQAVVLPRGVDHLPAFPDVMRERLLHVDVPARLAGPDRRQGVPVLHRRHRNDVQILAIHQPADVDDLVGLVAEALLDRLGKGGATACGPDRRRPRSARPSAGRTRRRGRRRGRRSRSPPCGSRRWPPAHASWQASARNRSGRGRRSANKLTTRHRTEHHASPLTISLVAVSVKPCLLGKEIPARD